MGVLSFSLTTQPHQTRYEEDCDACVVVLVWPKYFDADMVDRAREMCLGMAKSRIKWQYVAQNLGISG